MGIESILEREEHRDIAETYHESDEWVRGQGSGQWYFDGEDGRFVEITGGAPTKWADVLGVSEVQVEPGHYPLGFTAAKPNRYGYPLEMSLDIQDAPEYPDMVQHQISLSDTGGYNPDKAMEAERLHEVTFLFEKNAYRTSERFMNAVQAIHDNVEGELQRIRFSGEDINGRSARIEYVEEAV